MNGANIIRWGDLSDEGKTAILARPEASQDPAIRDGAEKIVMAVRQRGDTALAELTLEFDNAARDDLRVSDDEIRQAEAALTEKEVEAIDLAIGNVRRFHVAQAPNEVVVETMPGVVCKRISQPLDAVGLYVPAGTAPLPSAAIMLAVPAVIAGCPEIVMCTPPRPDGSVDPAVAVAATRAGVESIYAVGGAQAIAAMAYGTASIPRVRKIFGPGNSWVTAAKTIVSSDAGGAAIDMPAGPSEVLVIADASANPVFVAADLLSQAEHGTDSQVVLVSTDEELVERVAVEIEEQLAVLPRARIARQALANSRLIVAANLETAVVISNRYAPEHLILQVEAAGDLLENVRNAGSVFVGALTPESVGDYCSGTNHVLPTYGYAASYSGLGLDQFLRQMTVQELTADGLKRLGPAVITLAGMESLDAHAAAVRCRLEHLG